MEAALASILLVPGGFRDRAIVLTLVLTGRRRSEIPNLKVGDIPRTGELFYTYPGKGGKRAKRESCRDLCLRPSRRRLAPNRARVRLQTECKRTAYNGSLGADKRAAPKGGFQIRSGPSQQGAAPFIIARARLKIC